MMRDIELVKSFGYYAFLRVPGIFWIWLLANNRQELSYLAFGIASVISSLIVATFDSGSLVRAQVLTENQCKFYEKRRYLLTIVLLILAVLFSIFHNLIGIYFSIISAGELAMNHYRQKWRKAKQVKLEQRLELMRQTLSVSLGTAVFFLTEDPNSAILANISIYLVFCGLLLKHGSILRNKGTDEGPRISIYLDFNQFLGAIYQSIDVLLIGFLIGGNYAQDFAIYSLIFWYSTMPFQLMLNRIPVNEFSQFKQEMFMLRMLIPVACMGLLLTAQAMKLIDMTFTGILCIGVASFFRCFNWQYNIVLAIHQKYFRRGFNVSVAIMIKILSIFVLFDSKSFYFVILLSEAYLLTNRFARADD
jgi:hypothetical protein